MNRVNGRKQKWRENHRRKGDYVIPGDVLLGLNPVIREQPRRILCMMTADMDVVEFNDSPTVTKKLVKEHLDKRRSVVRANSSDQGKENRQTKRTI